MLFRSLQKLHQWYTFPEPFNKKVDSLAISKMSTALSSWKHRVKGKIEKGLSWEEIKAKEPMLDQEEFEEFKLSPLMLINSSRERYASTGALRRIKLGKSYLHS